MRKTADDGITLSTSPSYCCTGCVSVLHRRDTEQIYSWKMMPWMMTHKDLKPRINLLPSNKCPPTTLVVLTSRTRVNNLFFVWFHSQQGKKWNKPLCSSAALDRLCCNTLKHSWNGCKHKVAASPRSPGCVRYEIHSRLCVFVSWSRGIINPLNWDSQRLVQIMVLRTQTAPQRDEVGGMLLNATWRLNFKNTSAFMKNGIHVDELFIWWVNIHLRLYAPHRPDIREEQVDYRFKVIGP